MRYVRRLYLHDRQRMAARDSEGRVMSPPREIVLSVSPETVTVNGYRYKATDPAWIGLDFTTAEIRYWDKPPNDPRLRVPFCHPLDQPCDEDTLCYYRVYPIAEPGKRWKRRLVESVAIEPAPEMDPPWQIRVRFGARGG